MYVAVVMQPTGMYCVGCTTFAMQCVLVYIAASLPVAIALYKSGIFCQLSTFHTNVTFYTSTGVSVTVDFILNTELAYFLLLQKN